MLLLGNECGLRGIKHIGTDMLVCVSGKNVFCWVALHHFTVDYFPLALLKVFYCLPSCCVKRKSQFFNDIFVLTQSQVCVLEFKTIS